MKHLYLGLGILVLILLLGLGSLGLMERTLEKTEGTLTEAWEACRREDRTAARQAVEQAGQYWRRSYGLTASFVDHAPLDEVNRVFARMEACGEMEQWDEFAQTCRELISLIHGIADRELPRYYNIL